MGAVEFILEGFREYFVTKRAHAASPQPGAAPPTASGAFWKKAKEASQDAMLFATYAGNMVGGLFNYKSYVHLPSGDITLGDYLFSSWNALWMAAADGASYLVDNIPGYRGAVKKRQDQITKARESAENEKKRAYENLDKMRDPLNPDSLVSDITAEKAQLDDWKQALMRDLLLRRSRKERDDYLAPEQYTEELDKIGQEYADRLLQAKTGAQRNMPTYRQRKDEIESRYVDAIRNAEIGLPYPPGYTLLKSIPEAFMAYFVTDTGLKALNNAAQVFLGPPENQDAPLYRLVAGAGAVTAGWLAGWGAWSHIRSSKEGGIYAITPAGQIDPASMRNFLTAAGIGTAAYFGIKEGVSELAGGSGDLIKALYDTIPSGVMIAAGQLARPLLSFYYKRSQAQQRKRGQSPAQTAPGNADGMGPSSEHDLTVTLERYETELEQAAQDIQTLEREHQDLTRQYENLTRQYQNDRQETDELRRNNRDLHRQHEDLRNTLERSETALGELRDEKQFSDMQTSLLKDELRKLTADYSSLRLEATEQLDRLTAERDYYRKGADNLKIELGKTYDSDRALWKQERTQLTSELERLRGELAGTQPGKDKPADADEGQNKQEKEGE
ncbi:MAG: hypothetical protein HY514_03865 [Candidatus Aenigmarchaeota archaeon]|nr:hypothetical protein [Candidatus Aenigmarchaeota archaeon]